MRIGLICCLLCVSALPAMAESIELPSFGIVSAAYSEGLAACP